MEKWKKNNTLNSIKIAEYPFKIAEKYCYGVLILLVASTKLNAMFLVHI